MVEDGAQGAGEGGGVGGVNGLSIRIIRRWWGGSGLHDQLRPDVDARVPGEGCGAAGAVPVAEGVECVGRDIETQAAGALEGVELGGREEIEVVPIKGDGHIAVGPKDVDDGLEGGASNTWRSKPSMSSLRASGRRGSRLQGWRGGCVG